MALKVVAAGRTDVGQVRQQNEDTLHTDHANRVFAVFDGMGGHQAGEVASQTARDVLDAVFNEFSQELLSDERLHVGRALPDTTSLLLRGIRLANRQVYNQSKADSAKSGMGTTVVAMTAEADVMTVVHVGDSRAYRLDRDHLTPLTVDHSWVAEMQATHNLTEEEAGSVVGKNIITRALGVRENVEIDCRLVRTEPGQVYLMCSDGLCGFASDNEIFDTAAELRDNPQEMVKALVDLANGKGGLDNVTVIAVTVEEVDETGIPEVDLFTLGAESPELLEVEDEWLGRFDAELKKKRSEPPPQVTTEEQEQKPQSKALLAFIFLIFVLIALAIIYFYPAK